jgi:glycosyltransferase involved in cell wall biosynthesis
MKKILISAYACNPSKGSEPGNGWNWSYHVATRGYEVYCLTTVKGREDIQIKLAELNLPNLKFVYVDVPHWVDKLYKYQAGVYFHYFYWQHQAYKNARNLDKEVDFDIVHHVTYNSLQFGSELWKINKPMVYGPSGGGQLSLPILRKYFGKHWYKERIRNLISTVLIRFNRNTRSSVKNAHLFIASNEDTHLMASKLGAKKLSFMIDATIPESFVEKYYTPREPSDTLRILWIGRIYPRKGLNLVLEVLGQLKDIIPFKLTVIGDGPLRDELPVWIKQNNLEEYVDWRGKVPFSEVKAAYLSHDVFFFTSLRDSCPPQLLEAMATGLPIVTLAIHGAKTLVPDEAGIKVFPSSLLRTVEGLKEALQKLYSNPNQREEMGRKGIAYAQGQSWESRVDFIVKVYEESDK